MNILTYIIAIAVLIIVLKVITLPFKVAIKFIINSVIGGIVLLIFEFFGIGIVVNWWMIVLTGLFGVPGLVLSVLITILI
jgi:inhibitor of the pro-sigma K processing machinery